MDAEENRREDYDALEALGLNVLVLHVRSLLEINANMERLARAVGVSWGALDFGEPVPTQLVAFVPIWRRPWMALGTPTYGSSLLSHLGVATLFDSGGAYPTVGLDDVRSRQPDVVLAPSEPYPFGNRQRSELESVAPTYFLDGKDLFWWGQRTPKALGRLRNEVRRIISASQ